MDGCIQAVLRGAATNDDEVFGVKPYLADGVPIDPSWEPLREARLSACERGAGELATIEVNGSKPRYIGRTKTSEQPAAAVAAAAAAAAKETKRKARKGAGSPP